MNDAVRNLRENARLSLCEAVNAASLNPARRLGLAAKGSLERGKDADIVICTEDLHILRTIVGGRTVYDAQAARVS